MELFCKDTFRFQNLKYGKWDSNHSSQYFEAEHLNQLTLNDLREVSKQYTTTSTTLKVGNMDFNRTVLQKHYVDTFLMSSNKHETQVQSSQQTRSNLLRVGSDRYMLLAKNRCIHSFLLFEKKLSVKLIIVDQCDAVDESFTFTWENVFGSSTSDNKYLSHPATNSD